MITAYCLSYGNWTVIPHQWEECFGQLADLGYDAVALSYSESEHVYSRRAMENQILLAHKKGLKVFLIPSRFGGRFAGAPLMDSRWLCEHPEAQVPGRPQLACMDSEIFIEWFSGMMKSLVTAYPADGIVWDEPKYAQCISTHPDTLKKYNGIPTSEQAQDSFLEFLDGQNRLIRSLRPEMTLTLFHSKVNPEYFTEKSARMPELDYFGYDGTLSDQSFFHEPAFPNKYQIFEVMPRLKRERKRNTFALLENILLPSEANREYEENLERFLAGEHVDHLALYYYGHNNQDAELIQEITNRTLSRYLHRFKNG